MTTLPDDGSILSGVIVEKAGEPRFTICDTFAEQLLERGEATAVAFEGQQLSYAELDRRSNRLAHYLKRLGYRSEARIGICIERSLELIIGLLGILKAGGSYVPLDPNYPQERLAFMIEDAEIDVLLVQERLAAQLPTSLVPRVLIDREWQKIAKEPRTVPETKISPDNLAYIIYTSGSTGMPKGVCVCHKSVVRLVRNTDYAHFGADEAFLQFAPISFDAATFEIWGALLNGARLFVFPPDLPSIQDLGDWLSSHEVTTAWLTAGLFHQLVESDPGYYFRNMRQLLAGGDVLSVGTVQKYLQRYTRCRLINGYGPTENTTFSSCGHVNEMQAEASSVPIGKAISNSQVYVLDEELNPVPEGAVGELFLGGAGLARGYWKRPELTAEKFIPNALSGNPGDRMYRSGDMARFLPGGILEFIGRMDRQVKLRGFRIELGEIEAVLERHAEVSRAVVIAAGNSTSDKRLIAYVASQSASKLSTSRLRDYLSSKLPEYMVPSAFVVLEQMPLTANGKIDRQALSCIPAGRLDLEQTYVPPRTDMEQTLCAIWSDILQVAQVGIDDNFLQLGGHSLVAIQICSRLKNACGLQLRPRDLYQHGTVAALARFLESSGVPAITKYKPILPASRTQVIPLGASQERIWFLQQLEPLNTAYYFQATIDIEGPLNVVAFESSLREMVARHEILRTAFAEKDGRAIQVIHENFDVSLPVVSLEHIPASGHGATILQVSQQEVEKRFDVGKVPLIRWVLFRLAENRHVLLHLEHHLIHDGWSFNVFLGELFKLYEAFSLGQPSPLSPARVQFADFALWQQDFLASDEVCSQLAYWEKQLAGTSLITQVPTDRPRPHMQTFKGAVLRVSLPLPIAQATRSFSNQERTSLFASMMATFAALAYRYTQQGDLCIGSSVAGRQHPDTEDLLGMLVNNVVLRTHISGDTSFRKLLCDVHSLIVEATDNQDVPYHTVIQRLNVERNPSVNPGFQLMFNFHHSPITVPALRELKLNLAEGLGNGGAKFDVGVIAIPSSERRLRLNSEWNRDEIVMLWEYNTDLFYEETIRRMIGHYERLLEDAIRAPERKIGELQLLSEEERRHLLVDRNQTQAEYPQQRSFPQWFEKQVSRVPKAIAVEFEGRKLTYTELNQEANRLAHHLISLGAGPEVLVGICMERSLDMLVALLGILKAGAAYVPLDPAYPAERIAYILKDAQADFLLTTESVPSGLPSYSGNIVCLDRQWDVIHGYDATNPAPRMLPDHLAYVIYTSGSTGKPKGVQISHRALVNFLASMAHEPRMRSEDILMAVTTLSFDIAGLELYLPLVCGARVRILSRESCVDGAKLLHEVNNGATVLQATPTSWLLLLAAGWKGSAGLKALCGGEALSPELAKKLLPRCRSLWNMYGPTETTIFSLIDHVQESDTRIAIGHPVANTRAYVLDEAREPVAVGITGELYLGGDGLARGYLGRPDLTAERFVPDPFDSGGGRLYRTGDWARYLPNGKIECLGRMDFQVKIRGHRIELGEIESTLLEHPAIERAVVMVRDSARGDKELVAYVVQVKGQQTTISDLQAFLLQKLPRYMVPTQILVLEQIPLTANGKIDRNALPLPGLKQAAAHSKYIAPRTPMEQALAEIWADVLMVKQVGVEDDFFQLGGHSLLGTQVISRLRKIYSIELPLRRIFERPNIGQLAVAVEEALTGKIELLSEEKAERMLASGAAFTGNGA